MQNHLVSRRSLIQIAGTGLLAKTLYGARPFWERKQPGDWSSEEILQLLNRSPWARETNLDFEATEGGHFEIPPVSGAPAQPGEPIRRPEAPAGPLQRTPVVVRWETAEPIRDAMQLPPMQAFKDHYVLCVSNIPPGAMSRRRPGSREAAPTLEEMLAELQGAATLSAPGRESAGCDLVRKVAGSENNYLFGFEKELLPLTGNEKEILFVLRTARVSVKAKFEPKNMVYRGKFAV